MTIGSEKHRRLRSRQAIDTVSTTHPGEKADPLTRILLKHGLDLTVLEAFAGIGQLTKVYEGLGCTVTAWDKRLGTGDSWKNLLQAAGAFKYDVVDLDPYGFPSRAFPHIFLYLEDGYLFLTFPKPHVNVLNGITRQHLESWWGSSQLTPETIGDRLAAYGLMYWREVEVIDVIDLGRLWRLAVRVKRVKATEYTGVRNRAAFKTPQGRLL
jgi:hypothetical protein